MIFTTLQVNMIFTTLQVNMIFTTLQVNLIFTTLQVNLIFTTLQVNLIFTTLQVNLIFTTVQVNMIFTTVQVNMIFTTLQVKHEALERPISELLKLLTGDYTDDISKARAIYRWITSQAISTTEYKKNAKPNTAMYHLWHLKNKRNTYAGFFSVLCG